VPVDVEQLHLSLAIGLTSADVGVKLLPHRDLHRCWIASKSRWSTTRSEEYRAYTWCASGVCSLKSLVNIYFP